MPRIEPITGFIYHCDNCGGRHTQNNSTGHYTQSTPPGWLTITAHAPYPDESTPPRGYKSSATFLLCIKCAEPFKKLLFAIGMTDDAKK